MSTQRSPLGPREADIAARAARWLALGAAALGVLYALFFAYHAFLTAAFPYDLDWGEGYVLNDALRLQRGEPIYVDIRHFPMVRSPYPPLFLALNAVLLVFTGPGFLAGRLLSILATMVTALLVYRVALAHGSKKLPALVAALFVVASPYVYQWAPYSRVDMLAVAISLLALHLSSGEPTSKRLVLAGLVALGALFTKQTAIAVPLSISVALLLASPRRAAWFLLGLVPPGAVILALLASSTDGQFITHVLTGNAGNPTNLARLIVFQAQFTLLHPLLLVAALGYAVAEIRTGRPSVLAMAVLCAWVVSATVANEASSVNYFLETVALGSAAAGAGWSRFAQRDAGRALLASALVLLQLVLVFHVPNTFGVWPSFFPPHGYTPTAGDAEIGRQIDLAVAATPGEVLAEPAGSALRNGRPVYVQPLDLRAEQLRGRWDSAELRAAIRGHRFGLIVLSYGFFPNDVLAEIHGSYVLERSFQSPNGLPYSLYRPGQ